MDVLEEGKIDYNGWDVDELKAELRRLDGRGIDLATDLDARGIEFDADKMPPELDALIASVRRVRRALADKGVETLAFIECSEHGTAEWTGQVVCAKDQGGCGRVWHLGEDERSPPDGLGSKCVCGAELSHEDNDDAASRSICPGCFDARWELQSKLLRS